MPAAAACLQGETRQVEMEAVEGETVGRWSQVTVMGGDIPFTQLDTHLHGLDWFGWD